MENRSTWVLRACRVLAAVAAGLAGPAVAAEFAALPPERDFCLLRDYGAAHLAAHPRQIVTGIAIMARNGRESARAGLLPASLVVRFADRTALLAMAGACHERGPDAVECSFSLDHDQDVLASELTVERQPDGRFRVSASGDWKVLREGAIPEDSYGAITTDDAVFLLEAVPPERCAFDPALWTADGPTPDLMDRMP